MIGDLAYRPYLATGWVKAVGETVNRADYPTLVAFADANSLWTSNQANEPWKFGNGNGSTTMVLPNYAERFVEGGNSPGKRNAGLPNITGYLGMSLPGGKTIIQSTGVGALFNNGPINSLVTGYVEGTSTPVNRSADTFIRLDASKSNDIYGASNTVQPPAIVLIPQIKY